MGFLKYYFYIIPALFALIIYGCLPSLIKVDIKNDPQAYTMFGRTQDRNFYLPATIGDSLVEKWETSINGGLTNSSVTVYNSCVFVNDLSGWITCLDLRNGKRIGQIKEKGAVYSSPVIEQNILIFPIVLNNENITDLFFYNYRTGEPINKVEVEGKILNELLKTNDGIIFAAENGIAAKYNFVGTKIWETNLGAMCHSSPSSNGSVVFFGNDKGEIILLNEKDGKEIYKKKIGNPFYGGSTIKDNTAYIGDDEGILFAVDISSGNVKWKINTGTRIFAVPVLNNQFVFIGNLGGKLYSLDKDSGKLNWEKNIGGVINATPLLTKNYLIVPDLNGRLIFVDEADGKIKREYNLPGHVKTSPVYTKDLLFIGYDNGILKAYEIL